MILPVGYYSRNYKEDMAVVRTRFRWGILIASLTLLFFIPFFSSSNLIVFCITVCIWIIAALGLGIVVGLCGQLVICQSAIMAIGALISAMLVTKAGIPFFVALFCSALVSGLVGIFIGLVTVRVKEFYLALVTLGAYFILMFLLVRLTNVGPGFEVPKVQVGVMVLSGPYSFYYIAVGFAVLFIFLTKNVARSGLGRAFIAIRDNDLVAQAQGINVYRYKLVAFFLSSFYAGSSGVLLAFFWGIAVPDHYSFFDSIWLLAITFIGGPTVSGVVMGTVFLRGIMEFGQLVATRLLLVPGIPEDISASMQPILVGLMIVLFVIFEPRGLAHLWEIIYVRARLRPFIR
jgi:branched-chain amino acid transport system permease protein